MCTTTTLDRTTYPMPGGRAAREPQPVPVDMAAYLMVRRRALLAELAEIERQLGIQRNRS